MATPDSVSGSECKSHKDWIVDMYSALTLGEPDENSANNPICIFQVPKSISDDKPEAYTPQLIALGPYHFFNPNLYDTGRPYKIKAAKMAIAQFQLPGFDELVDRIQRRAQEIRSNYLGDLNVKDEDLSGMMAVDAPFLLGVLETLRNEEAGEGYGLPNKPGHHWQFAVVLKDLMMLENQIPLFVLTELLTMSRSSDSVPTGQMLSGMLVNLCKEICLIKRYWRFNLEANEFNLLNRKHFLDLMYQLTVGNSMEGCANSTQQPSCCRSCRAVIMKIFNSLISLFCLPLYYCVSIPCMKLTDCVLYVLEQFGISSDTEKNVQIPSVEELERAGVKFTWSIGGIKSIEFDSENGKFSIPRINLNPTSEVVMMNLLAYETMTQKDFFPLKRYTELMNAMVDTRKDVRVLRRARVIESKLKDVEVLEILNGMGKPMTAKDKNIEKAIDKANEYYKHATTVRLGRFMKKYVYSYWKVLAFLASVFLLILTIVQTFCGFYDCPKIN